MQKNVEKKIPVYTHTHRWEGIEEIEETPKRSITGVKILIGVVFTITVGSILTTVQKLNLQLPNIPISIVNDGEKAGSNDGMFFRINPGSNYEHIDYSNVTGQNDVVMKITAIDYKKKDKGGWGDGTMVQSNGEYLLMDLYHRNCLPSLLLYLEKNGINKTSIYISHDDIDHTSGLDDDNPYSGIKEILKKVNVDKMYLPKLDRFKDLEELVKKESPNTQIIYLKKGSKFKIGLCEVEVILGPIEQKKGEENNESLITRITTPQGVRFLTAGDAEKELEKMALDAEIDLSADIYKMSHHGGNTSNTEAFVRAVNPSFFFYNYNNEGHGAKEKSFGKAGWIKKPVEVLDSLGNGASVLYQGQLDWVIYSSTKIEFSAAKSSKTEKVTFTQIIDGKKVKFTHVLTKGSSHIYTEQMKKADEIEYRNLKKTTKLYDYNNNLNAREMVKLYKPPAYKKEDGDEREI